MSHPALDAALSALRNFNRWRLMEPGLRAPALAAAHRALAIRRSRRTWLDQAMSAIDADEGEG